MSANRNNEREGKKKEHEKEQDKVNRKNDEQEKGDKNSTPESFMENSGSSPPDEVTVEMLVEGTSAEDGNPKTYISPSRKSRRIQVDFQKLERYNSSKSPSQFHRSTHRNQSGFLPAEIIEKSSVPPRWSWYRSKDKEDTRKKNRQVWEVLNDMAPQQRTAVILLFGLKGEEPKTQCEVAEIMGIAQQTVSEYWKAAQRSFSKKWVRKGFPLRKK